MNAACGAQSASIRKMPPKAQEIFLLRVSKSDTVSGNEWHISRPSCRTWLNDWMRLLLPIFLVSITLLHLSDDSSANDLQPLTPLAKP